ncbi:heavy metal translocating P-type ATPase [Patescibacteria group bacterium]|nr:heavy metal translocating P-type ATPase [Patescibacteria group bacterium]
MHPEIIQDAPGMCPECGMNLVPIKRNGKQSTEQDEYDKHAGHSTTAFIKKFWIVAALTVPILAYSEIAEKIFSWQAPQFPGYDYIILLLASIVFFYGGWVFLAGAYRELKARLPGMMTLIAVAISAAYLFSAYSVLAGAKHTLFWELSTLIAVMLLGHWIEMAAVSGAQGALKELSKLLPDVAEIIRNGKHETIPLSEIHENDLLFVRPGARIPADGTVTDGQSEVNESMVTGESALVAKNPQREVIAGTVNGDGALTIRVTKIGERTFLAGIMRLIREAQASKSRLQLLSDKAAFYLTLVAIGTGGLSFVLWLFARAGFGFAVERLVAVLVIACPHALGLAVPLVASISTTLAARHGFLVKQRLALEAARNIDVVLFDKTGTLTKGEYGVIKIQNAKIKSQNDNSKLKIDENEILKLAASVDSHSEHVIARALVNEARRKNIVLYEVKEFARIAGKGTKGIVEGKEVFVGGGAVLDEVGIKLPKEMEHEAETLARQGKTIIYVVADKKLLGAIALADVIRSESREAVADLKHRGVRVAMMTGDSEGVAEWVAKELGIDEYFAKTLPHEKSEKVKLLQKKGLKVAMVGDGINDAPALAQADLGIAIGAGTNVAIESAGIILVRNDPRDIVKIIRLSSATYSKMIQNLFWATGYNVIALPLAAGVLVSRGIILQPAVSAVLMSLSTVIVAINAVLLRRIKI